MGLLGAAIRDLWTLDPQAAFLNHGSFGAAPRVVQQEQQRLRDALERQPVDFMMDSMTALRGAIAPVELLLGADRGGLAFVDNATTGVNAVVRGLRLGPGDALLTTSHAYGAVTSTLRYCCDRSGAELIEVPVPFPIRDPQQVLDAVERALSERVKLAVVDHITSVTALVLPVAELVALCHDRGVPVLVDGAHVPGHLPVDLSALGADYWVGNGHKWLYTPKGCAFLYARPELRSELHPTVISHGYGAGWHAEFDWQGTRDPTAWLTAPRAVAFAEELGLDAVQRYGHELAHRAAELLSEAFGTPRPAPESMLASMATVQLPFDLPDMGAAFALRSEVWRKHRVEAAFFPFGGRGWVRPCCPPYVVLEDVERLAAAIGPLGVR